MPGEGTIPKRALAAIPPQLVAQRERELGKIYNQTCGVLHLGAHEGQERKTYREFGLPALWIEANPATHETLSANLASFENQSALCALLADVDGRREKFHISNNVRGVSSSIFEFGAYGDGEHTLWPSQNLAMTGFIVLPTITLDTLLSTNAVDAAAYDFWVLDLQGAELLALRGARQSIKSCRAIYTEISTVEVYKGGALWNDLAAELGDYGFTPVWEPCREHDDILFVRGEA